MYNCQLDDRFVYSNNNLIHESNHIQVYEGLDMRNQQPIYVKIVDEKAFNMFDRQTNQQEKDIIFKTGIEIKKQQIEMFTQLANTNQSRQFSPQVLDVLEIQSSQIAVILQGSKFGTLNEYLQRNNYLEEYDALLIFKQVALGLQELHNQQIVHGAICLDNIQVDEMAFSLTCLSIPGGQFSKITHQTQQQEVESNYYLSPEILANITAQKTMKSDIWALGILFFRLLRGRYFYGGKTREEIYNQITAHKTIMKSWLDEFDKREGDFPIQISRQCQFFLGKMLAKNPDDRPTISEVLNNSLLEVVKIIGKNDQSSISNIKKYGGDLLMNLPPNLQNSQIGAQYTFFRESRIRNDIDGYMVEDLYFGVMLKPHQNQTSNIKQYDKSLIRLKVVGNFPHQKVDRFLENVEKFQQLELFDAAGRSEIVRIYEIVYLLPGQLNNPLGQVIIAQDYCNQGNLNEYFIKRKNTNQKSVYEIDATLVMHRLLNTMTKICRVLNFHGAFHMKNLYLDQGMIKIGEPLIISSITEQKFQENREIFDYFAPEYKQDVGIYDPRADLHKVDIWSFGMIFYKMVFGDIPIFDLNQKPIFSQSSNQYISERVRNIIRLCLLINVDQRAEWPDITQSMQEEQIEQQYDLTIKPLPLTNESLKLENQINDDIVPYEHKGLSEKYKMKNMLSKVNVESNLNNNNQQKKGRFFQKSQQEKAVDDNESSNQFQQKKGSFYDNDDNTIEKNRLDQTGIKTNVENEEDDIHGTTNNLDYHQVNQSVNNSMLNDSKYKIIDYENNKYHHNEDLENNNNQLNNIEQNVENTSQHTQMYQVNNTNADNENLIQIKTEQVENKSNNLYDKSQSRSPSKANFNNNSRILKQEDDYDYIDQIQLTDNKKFRENKQVISQQEQGTIKPQPNILLRYNEKQEEEVIRLVPSKTTGGNKLSLLRKLIKALLFILLFLTVFYRNNMANSWSAIFVRGNMKIIQMSYQNGSNQNQLASIITTNQQQLLNYDINYLQTIQVYGCLDNLQFMSTTNQLQIIEVLRSTAFFFFAFLSFLSMIFILIIRIIHVWRLDLYTIYQNYQNGLLKPYNRYLFHCQIISYLEFSFIYYSHYQLFNFFYYCVLSPCLGVTVINNNTPILSDSSKYQLSGMLGDYFTKIVCTNALFGTIHILFIIYYIIFPLKNSELFMNYYHAIIRGSSYIFGCWIMCRIGGFLIFQPTYSYDNDSFIAATLGTGEYQSVFGFIPELMEIILIAVDLLVEFLFYQIGLFYDKQTNYTVSKRKRDAVYPNIQFKRNPVHIQLKSQLSYKQVTHSQKTLSMKQL
ncbi:kinase domain protein (macronuclear) [Tetrahymena thermophila SB210]|uniref:Kinase domain protein n=1 Tax=Tetrahymena thermophila (strain SB210) TaxID=312017 RepID=I7M631_TETTS|nr:kinase domain protein [Tetrahymena thermophila SB210]EAR84109.2 kinase domain protein [Tetrahymena thermophila SB210]|eukprot:XP_001031772.2 kinase domain protein [Tetrahymena thermophila SB210]